MAKACGWTLKERYATTTKHAHRRAAAIGTAVGAIIGAIAGGGKAQRLGPSWRRSGAGSIYVEGRNDLDLDRGTQLVLRAGAPYSGPRYSKTDDHLEAGVVAASNLMITE
jgi:hypothetical protein